MGSGQRAPKLEVAWGGDLRDFWESLRVFAGLLSLASDGDGVEPFRTRSIRYERSARALVLSLLLHVLFLVTPLPEFLTRPSARPSGLEMVRIEYDLEWMANSRVLPPIFPAAPIQAESSPGGKEEEPFPPPGTDEVAPQTIVSSPPEPNHPTQVVQHQLAVEQASVQAPDIQLPNMVIPPSEAPTPEIDLSRLHIPDAPLDLAGPPQAPQVPRPKSQGELALENTKLENLLPRLTLDSSTGNEVGEAAPEVQVSVGVPRSGDLDAPGVLALSGNPGAPAPGLELPEGNLRARFAVGPHAGEGSPGGVPGGTPGGEGGAGGGPGGVAGGSGDLTAPDIYVAPAGPTPAGPVIVGLQPDSSGPPPPPQPLPERPRPQSEVAATVEPGRPVEKRAEELLEGISPGQRPGEFPSWRRVYTVYINMPNLTSQAGSWVLRFAELGKGSSTAAGGAGDHYPLAAPIPVKKVDPRYSPTARREGVEGTVSLYGIIRSDGSVADVHVVRGLHDELDQNAVEAFRRWRFEPGHKNGSAVTLEVVIEIPFRLSRLF